MKALVTGAAGFIGSHLVDLLIDEGYFVYGIDNLFSGSLQNLNKHNKNPKFDFLEADITQNNDLNKIPKQFDVVFHLAGLADIVPSIENPNEYFMVNVQGTLNLLEYSRLNDINRFIYAASSSCYGIPQNYPTDENENVQPQYPYALTKYLGEELVIHWATCYGLNVNSLRLFNVYGPRSRTSGAYGAVFGVFLAQKINNKPFTIVGNGEQTRDFTYVTDVVNAFHKVSLKKNISKEIFNIGSGNHYTINYLADLLQGNKIYIPKRPGEPDCTFASIEKIKELINWEPKVSIEQGVKIMIENIDLWKNAPVWDSSSIKDATKTWFKYLG